MNKPRGKAYRPMGDIIAAAAGVNVNTIYDLAKQLNKYIEVKAVIPDGQTNSNN